MVDTRIIKIVFVLDTVNLDQKIAFKLLNGCND